jgi:hypothetical protein
MDKKSRNHLRLLKGGKAEAPKKQENHDETDLLNEQNSKIWKAVLQASPPSIGSLLDEAAQERQQVEKIISERLHELNEMYPGHDLTDLASMTAEMREILFAPPLILMPDGSFVIIAD